MDPLAYHPGFRPCIRRGSAGRPATNNSPGLLRVVAAKTARVPVTVVHRSGQVTTQGLKSLNPRQPRKDPAAPGSTAGR